MLSKAHQDIHERMADRPRRGERARMVAAFPDVSTTSERAVHGAGEPDGESADAGRERAGVGGLGEKMDVVVLNGKLHDAEVGARAGRESAADRGEHPRCAETTEPGPQRDVHGMRRRMLRPSAVRNAGAAAGRGLSPGSAATPTPSAGRRERQLKRSSYLDWARSCISRRSVVAHACAVVSIATQVGTTRDRPSAPTRAAATNAPAADKPSETAISRGNTEAAQPSATQLSAGTARTTTSRRGYGISISSATNAARIS